MATSKHTEAEESAFMDDLLAGIDASFFDAVPSPDRPSETHKVSFKSSRSPDAVSGPHVIYCGNLQ